MKLQFKRQAYQAASVESIVDCFAGQPKSTGIQYRIDPGREKHAAQLRLQTMDEVSGFKNADLALPKFSVGRTSLFLRLS